jgi:hypothetical protein
VRQKGIAHLFLLIIVIIVALGAIGYLAYQNAQLKKRANDVIPTQNPTSAVQPSPTATPIDDSGTKLLEPSLVSTADWQTMSFPQNVVVSQGGESRQAYIEFKTPSNWSTEAIKAETNEHIGGVICKDIKVTSEDGNLTLLIMPDCGGSSPDSLPIAGSVQKVELTTNKGNDGHDSYSVRYHDSTNNIYHYGSIGVSPGANIDIQGDKIYPHLILQYEPDRHEQWLWTSYDLTYNGAVNNQQTALNTADTIISTMKLTD